MKTETIKKMLCVLAVGVPMVLGAVAAGQNQNLSVIDRVKQVEDPELGDLIRLAMENQKNISKQEAFEVVRQVTQSYSQIKLLDLQVEQLAQKAEVTAGPADMRYELLLAKAELESKRTTELGNLREMVGIIPRLPLAEQPIETLATYISIQIIGDRLYVLNGEKPFIDWWCRLRWKVAGLLSEKETLEHIRDRLKNKDNLPARIEIYHDPQADAVARDLRNRIIEVAKETHSQMETDVRLVPVMITDWANSTFYLRNGTITTFYTEPMQRPDGGSEPLVSGLVDPTDLEQHILWRLTMPKNVPLTFRIEYDQQSASLASQVADKVKAIVKQLDIGELVKVNKVLVDPFAETVFLGIWRGETRGDIYELDVRPNGVCQVTMGDRFGNYKTPGAVKAGMTVPGTWLMTTSEMIIDIKDKNEWGGYSMYRGYIDEEGNLIVDRGMISPRGGFDLSAEPRQMVLKKVTEAG